MRCIVWTSCLLCWLSGDWRCLRAVLPQPASPEASTEHCLSEQVSSVLPEACLHCALREGVSSDGSLTLGQDRGEHWPSSAQNSQRAPSELCFLPQTAFLGALLPKISTVPRSPFSMKLTHFLFSEIPRARAPKNVYTCPEPKSLGGRKVPLPSLASSV